MLPPVVVALGAGCDKGDDGASSPASRPSQLFRGLDHRTAFSFVAGGVVAVVLVPAFVDDTDAAAASPVALSPGQLSPTRYAFVLARVALLVASVAILGFVC